MGLAIFKGSQDRLKEEVIGNGKSRGTCHFFVLKMASPMGLAIFKRSQDRLREEVIGSGKSHGTCHFQIIKMASPVGLANSDFQ